jgi:hypothetical protein
MSTRPAPAICRGAARRPAGALPAIRRLLVLAGLVLLGLPVGPGSARAESAATCIEASRYAALARITDGDLGRIAHGLGRPNARPPADACRAVLLTGTIEPGTAKALLDAIGQNHGWLATVYVSISNGDLTAEVELAQLLRDFALEVRLLQADALYDPDFMAPPSTLPASVSNGWPAAQRDVATPLVAALEDYRQNYPRQIASGGLRCGTGCWTLLAAGVDRQLMNFPPRDARLPAGLPAGSADTDRVRAAIRSQYGFAATLRSAGAGYATEPAFARMASSVAQNVATACQSRIDYANELQSEVGKTVDGLAGHDFPLIQLAPLATKARAIQEASDAAERCAIAEMERERAKAFEKYCKPDCNAGTLLGPLEQSAKAAIARAGGS